MTHTENIGKILEVRILGIKWIKIIRQHYVSLSQLSPPPPLSTSSSAEQHSGTVQVYCNLYQHLL